MNRCVKKSVALLVLSIAMGAMASATHANIPAGTNLQVRISEKLSSETSNVGDHFHGSLTVPVVANGRTLFPRGAEVTGDVVDVERSGRLSSPGELHLALKTIRSSGRAYAL